MQSTQWWYSLYFTMVTYINLVATKSNCIHLTMKSPTCCMEKWIDGIETWIYQYCSIPTPIPAISNKLNSNYNSNSDLFASISVPIPIPSGIDPSPDWCDHFLYFFTKYNSPRYHINWIFFMILDHIVQNPLIPFLSF